MRDCSIEATYDADGVQATAAHDARGHELPDPVPTAPPVGYRAGPSLAETVARMCRQELSKMADDQGFETFEEAEDFDIEDDPLDPLTPYEAVFDLPRAGVGPLGAAPPSPPAAATTQDQAGAGAGGPPPPSNPPAGAPLAAEK